MDSKYQQWDVLATKAQSGDKQAYHTLLQELVPYVRKIIASGLANPHWVDDLLQEVLVGVHKSFSSYIPNQPFRPWVNAIIRYRRADFLSKYYNSPDYMKASLDGLDEIEDEANPLAFFQTVEDIERALSRLPQQQQQIFKQIRIEGYSIKEVAELNGMSESAVKVSAHRTAAKLKEIFQQA